jgi:hypothetical protein
MATEKNQSTQVESVTLSDIDDFLPMPSADDVVIGDGKSDAKKPSLFSRNAAVDMSFLEDDDEKKDDTADDKKDQAADDKKDPINTDDVLDDLNPTGDDDDDELSSKAGRKKVDKSGMVETFAKLIEEGLIIPFEDDKKLEEYSMKDWKELLEANFQEREQAIRDQTPKEFFESLPDELQYAARYVANGGTDIKGLFRALAQVEETKSFDPEADAHHVVRQYLRATNFGSDTDIEEQIKEWEDFGTLEKKAGSFKPKLEKMQEEILEEQIQRQEQYKKQQEKAARDYMNNVYETLKVGELNGVKIDKRVQTFLFSELTDAKYQSMSGKQTNLLGHLLEKYQFQEPRYDLVAEALWLLADPDAYKDQIRQQAKNQATQDTVRKLKTEEARKIAGTAADDKEEKVGRKIPRPSNIFRRS